MIERSPAQVPRRVRVAIDGPAGAGKSTVARGLARLFETRPGVTFLSDVEVMRSDYFARVDSDKG